MVWLGKGDFGIGMEVYGLQNSLIKDACGAVVRADGRDIIVEAVFQVIYHENSFCQ